MRPPGTGHGRERRRGAGADEGERWWRLSRGPGQGMQRPLSYNEAGDVSYSRGAGRRRLPSWLHPCVPAHEPDPQNSRDLPDFAAVSIGRCLLLQASGTTRFILPNCPP